MKTGITGLQYSGKTTLFCALTGQDFTKLSHSKDVHVGTVKVPDKRLDVLNDMFLPKKKTGATMEFFDLAGQSSAKEGVSDQQTLQTLRNADSLIIVLDAFSGESEPKADFRTITEEFALTDLVIATTRLERLEKEMKSGKAGQLVAEKAILEKCRDNLESEGVLSSLEMTDEEKKLIRGFQFLTMKPLLIVVNISEDLLLSGAASDYEEMFGDVANSKCAAVCAKVEMEITALDECERADFLDTMGIEEPALGRVIRLSYASLGLISFFTAGTDEVRAWTVRKGSLAPECAGAIHSDLERGFIRAETIAYEDLIREGSMKAAKEKGLLRIEGKDYQVKDGDILTIRFNV